MIENLNSDITYDEAFNVIISMKSSSPGPNCLTLRFYKKKFPLFGKNFVRMLNNLKNFLQKNFQDSVIELQYQVNCRTEYYVIAVPNNK